MTDRHVDLKELVSRNWDALTPGDRAVADYLLRSYPRFLFQTASEMARELDTSISTVTRFFPKIGFKSIRDAYAALKEQSSFVIDSPLDRYRQNQRGTRTEGVFFETLEADLSNLERTFAEVDRAAVRKFVELTSGSRRRVCILGSRKVFALAYYLYIQLSAVRSRVQLVRTDNYFEVESALEACKGDTLIVYDFRRYPRVHLRTAEWFKAQGAHIITICDSRLAPTRTLSDVAFTATTRGPSAFDSYTAAISLTNALLAELVRTMGDAARRRCERMERVYSHFDVWSRQNPPKRKFTQADR